MSQILVPLDGSRLGERALEPALAIAARIGSAIRLVHVLDEDDAAAAALVGADDSTAVAGRAAEYLDGIARWIGERSDAEVTTALLDGPVADAVRREVEARGAELLIMTTHGRGGLARAWLGSATDQIVRTMPVPVLVIRPPADDAAPQPEPYFEHVLVALDGSSRAECALGPALRLAEAFGARCTLLRVLPLSTVMAYRYAAYAVDLDQTALAERRRAAEKYLSEVAQRLEDRPVEIGTHVMTYEGAAPAILDFAREAGADLIAISTRGRGGLRRAVLGSVADKVLRGAESPVLVCRAAS